MITRLFRPITPLFAVLGLLFAATSAFAHASLVSSDPLNGASISTPYVLVLEFDEALKPVESQVVVRDGSGTAVADGSLGDDEFHMQVELPPLPVGDYTAHWVAITADDNGKTQGDVMFSVATTAAVSVSPATSAATATTPASTPAGTLGPALTPTPTTAVSTPGPTIGPVPTPGATVPAQAAGAELIVPLVLGGAVAIALAWFFVRRRPT